MYEMAKKAREKMKAKARSLAAEKDQKVDSSNWTPAPLLRAEIKTGARPIMKPSAKGIGESNQAADTKSAIGNPKRGAYKSGGGVLNKKAVGDVEVLPKRGATPKPYKKGGRVKKADGGGDPSYVGASSVTKDNKPVTRPKDLEQKREPDASDLYSAEQAKRLERGYKKGGKAKKVAKKKGGAVTGLTIVIADKGAKGAVQQAPVAPIAPRAVPVPPAAPPMAPPGAPPVMPPMARKSGGRISKVAKSYKDMTSGAESGEGRLQKTDIAKVKKKDGGRITKVASSYKDMEAGAATGEARLQKTDIAKKRKGAPTS